MKSISTNSGIKLFFLFLSLCVVIALFSSTATANTHIITPQTGSLTMTDANQGNRIFQTKSNSVIGFEYESRFKNGMAIGTSYQSYTNNYTSFGTPYKAETDIAFFTFKQYFNTSSPLKPFIGIGGGIALVETGEAFSLFESDFDGDAYKFMTGIVYDIGRVGFHLEYVHISADVEENGFSSSTFSISTNGIVGGLRIIFGGSK